MPSAGGVHVIIKEGKLALRWTRLSCRTFRDNTVHLQLFALAYNLANFLRSLALPDEMAHWSLTTLREKLVKIGTRIVRHGRHVFQLAEVAVPCRPVCRDPALDRPSLGAGAGFRAPTEPSWRMSASLCRCAHGQRQGATHGRTGAPLAEQLLDTGLDKLSERERRVITRVAERSQISRDVNRVFDEKQTLGDRLADRVARFGGSWTFIILFLGTLVAWAGLNSVVLAWYSTAFDPYPYIFLNLMLSMLAALQAPVILMSQNRQAARDRLAAGHDYEVNLKAELEIMGLHEKLDQMRSQHLEELLRAQQEQLGLLTQLTRANDKAGSGSSI